MLEGLRGSLCVEPTRAEPPRWICAQLAVAQDRPTAIARDYPLEAKIIRKAAVRLAVMRGVHKLAKVTGARDSSVPFDC